MANLIIKGFRNDEHAKAFIHWFEGQGEQDAGVWFDEKVKEANQTVNCKKTFPIKKDEQGNFIMILNE